MTNRKVIAIICYLVVILFAACGRDEVVSNKQIGEAPQRQEAAALPSAAVSPPTSVSTNAELDELLRQFFDPVAADFLRQLDQVFTDELRRRIADRPAEFLYTIHLESIRSQIIDGQSLKHLFPYGPDDPRLADMANVEGVDFLSSKCGFQDSRSGHTVNFICLFQESSLVDFLNSFGAENTMVNAFIRGVENNYGTLPADYLTRIAIRGGSELDLKLPTHRLFYALVHFLLVEEMDAKEAIRSYNRE